MGLKCILTKLIKSLSERLTCCRGKVNIPSCQNFSRVVWPTSELEFSNDSSALSFLPSWASQEGRATILLPPFPAAALHSLLLLQLPSCAFPLCAEPVLCVCLPPASQSSFIVEKKRRKSVFSLMQKCVMGFFFLVSEFIISWKGNCMPKAAVGLTSLPYMRGLSCMLVGRREKW